jgi:hypothetical protein
VQGDVSGYRERLVKFVEAQGITLNYSENIAPAKGLSYGGKSSYPKYANNARISR